MPATVVTPGAVVVEVVPPMVISRSVTLSVLFDVEVPVDVNLTVVSPITALVLNPDS